MAATRTARRSGYGSAAVAQVFNPAILWLMVELGDGEPDPSDRRLGHAI
jgi:hypothetical protein